MDGPSQRAQGQNIAPEHAKVGAGLDWKLATSTVLQTVNLGTPCLPSSLRRQRLIYRSFVSTEAQFVGTAASTNLMSHVDVSWTAMVVHLR